MCLIYRVISSPIDSSAGTRKIVCVYPKFCAMQYLDKVKLSAKDREGYKGDENLWVFFNSSSEPEIKEILDGSLASFSFTNISSLWSYSWFWLSFIEIEAGIE